MIDSGSIHRLLVDRRHIAVGPLVPLDRRIPFFLSPLTWSALLARHDFITVLLLLGVGD